MNLEDQIKAKWKEIETIDFIASRCSTDAQARVYEQNRREKVKELVELEKQLKERKV